MKKQRRKSYECRSPSNKRRPQLFQAGWQYANLSQRERRYIYDREPIGRFLRCKHGGNSIIDCNYSSKHLPYILKKETLEIWKSMWTDGCEVMLCFIRFQSSSLCLINWTARMHSSSGNTSAKSYNVLLLWWSRCSYMEVVVSMDMLFSFTDIILLHSYKEREYSEREKGWYCSQRVGMIITTV